MVVDKILNLSDEDVKFLYQKLESEDPSGLTREDIIKLRAIVDTWKGIFEGVSDGELNLRKIKQLLGIKQTRSSNDNEKSLEPSDHKREKPHNTDGQDDETHCQDMSKEQNDKPHKKTDNGHGRRGSNDFPDAPIYPYYHPELKPGDLCCVCSKGKVYILKRDGQLRSIARISGQAPLTASIHEFHDLRCNLCGEVFKVPLPDVLKNDKPLNYLYDYSAISMIAVSKYLSGMPWYRLSGMQRHLGIPISPTVMWDLNEELANKLKPIFKALILIAASGVLFYSDDTGALILNKRKETKKRRGTDKEYLRAGCHSSCVISQLEDGKQIALIKTDIIHAGEWLDEILSERNQLLPPPMHMSDRSSSNPAKVCETIDLGCNAHARVKFKDIRDKFKAACGKVLSIYSKVFKNDQKTKEMNPSDRKEFHENHSKPLMEDMFDIAQKAIDGKKVEPNSSLGKAYQYLLNHKKSFMGFIDHENAPIDNNLCERVIKFIVLLRKNSWFYKNTIGSAVSDIIMSIGQTCILSNINPFEYFVFIQQNEEAVKSNPMDFLPWKMERMIAKKNEQHNSLHPT